MNANRRNRRTFPRSLFKSLLRPFGISYRLSGGEDEELSRVAQVVGIHLVLDKISENLAPSDLLTCRLVSTSWNDLFTKQLLRRPSPALQICFRHVVGQYTLYQKYPKMAPRSLQQFSDLLQNSKKVHSLFPFPCVSFKFLGGPLDDLELQSFLKRFGVNLVHLELDLQLAFAPLKKEARLLQKLVLSQLPNLQNLKLAPPKFRLDSSVSTFPSLSSLATANALQNLVSIQGPDIPTPFMENLVVTCPNLQAISFALDTKTLPFLKFLVTSKKLGLIKHFIFTPNQKSGSIFDDPLSRPEKEWPRVFKTMEEALVPSFRPLTFHADLTRSGFTPIRLKRRATSLIVKLLQFSQSSLEKVKTRIPGCPNQSQDDWPVMPVVTEVHLLLESHEDPQFQNFELRLKFPKLHALIFDFGEFRVPSGGQGHGQSSPFNGVATSVRKIKFAGGISPKTCIVFLRHLSTHFPNVEELTIENTGGLSEIGEAIGACKSLKNLKLTLKLHHISNASQLDSFFTGFSVETCAAIQKEAIRGCLWRFGETNINRHPRKSSIVNLKGLEKLTVKIIVNKQYIALWPRRVMSQVTGKYAFDCLPNLMGKVNICVEFLSLWNFLEEEDYKEVQTVLGDIAPYTNICDFGTPRNGEKDDELSTTSDYSCDDDICHCCSLRRRLLWMTVWITAVVLLLLLGAPKYVFRILRLLGFF